VSSRRPVKGSASTQLVVFRGFVQTTKENRDDDDKEFVPQETVVGADDHSRLPISHRLSRADRRAGGRRDALWHDHGRIRRRASQRPSVDQEFGERQRSFDCDERGGTLHSAEPVTRGLCGIGVSCGICRGGDERHINGWSSAGLSIDPRNGMRAFWKHH
jgi:hypothetical protein